MSVRPLPPDPDRARDAGRGPATWIVAAALLLVGVAAVIVVGREAPPPRAPIAARDEAPASSGSSALPPAERTLAGRRPADRDTAPARAASPVAFAPTPGDAPADGTAPATGRTAEERLASLRYRADLRRQDALDALGELSTLADVEFDLSVAQWDDLCAPGRVGTGGARPVAGDEALRLLLGVPWRDAVADGRLRVGEPGAPTPPRGDPTWVRVPRRPSPAPSPSPTFAVVVLDADGRPLPGAELVEVALRRIVGRADAEGVVAVPARGWAYRVEYVVRAPGFRDSPRVAIPRGIAAGDRVEVRMTVRAARVRGVVTDEDGGPRAGASVAAVDVSQPDALATYPQRWVTTGADGRFDDPSAPTGAVVLVVHAARCGVAGVRLETRAGETTDADVRLLREATVAGVVRDGAGAPLDEAMVLAFADGLPAPFAWATTGADGTFRLDTLPAGRVRLAVRDGAGPPVDVTLSPGQALRLDLTR